MITREGSINVLHDSILAFLKEETKETILRHELVLHIDAVRALLDVIRRQDFELQRAFSRLRIVIQLEQVENWELRPRD